MLVQMLHGALARFGEPILDVVEAVHQKLMVTLAPMVRTHDRFDVCNALFWPGARETLQNRPSLA